MSRVVFVLNYRRDYLTLCITRLAVWYMRMGRDVKLVSLTPCDKGVDPYWDVRVLPAYAFNATAATAEAELVLWWSGARQAVAYLQSKWDAGQWQNVRHCLAFSAGTSEDFTYLYVTLAARTSLKYLVLQTRQGNWDPAKEGLDPQSDINVLVPYDPAPLLHTRQELLNGREGKARLTVFLPKKAAATLHMCQTVFAAKSLSALRDKFELSVLSFGAVCTEARRFLRRLASDVHYIRLPYLSAARALSHCSDVLLLADLSKDTALLCYNLYGTGATVCTEKMTEIGRCSVAKILPIRHFEFLAQLVRPETVEQESAVSYAEYQQGQQAVQLVLKGL